MAEGNASAKAAKTRAFKKECGWAGRKGRRPIVATSMLFGRNQDRGSRSEIIPKTYYRRQVREGTR